MEIDADDIFYKAIRNGLTEAVKSRFTGYNSPVDDLIKKAVEKHSGRFRELLESSIASCLDDIEFRETIAKQTRTSLAKLLVQRFGGEIEKQVNVLKSDPTTRARIVLAIEEITKQKQTV